MKSPRAVKRGNTKKHFFGLNLLYFLLPGYALALILTFFVPKIFSAVAFDSGGVASGAMTATFLLPFTVGACRSTGGDMMRDAFGVVALVAMTPLVTIQLMGLAYKLKVKKTEKEELVAAAHAVVHDDSYIDFDSMDARDDDSDPDGRA
jgi:hypothetical protein